MLLDEAEQKRLLEKITTRFTEIHLPEAAFAMSYIAMEAKNEITAAPFESIIQHLYPDCRFCYPAINLVDSSMEAIEMATGITVNKNKWGIPEPESGLVIDPQQIDVILVPLLAVDKQGFRVGYGKGFYDRFIARCRPDIITIGLSFFEPVHRIEDLGSYDVPLQFCVTPERLYRF